MANIKNFGLVGVGTDVQFGKSGPRLVNDTGAFKFRNAANNGFVNVQAQSLTVEGLKDNAGKVVTVDASGMLVLGATLDSFATDAEVTTAISDEATARNTAISNAVTPVQTEVNAIETAVGLETDGTLATITGTNYINGAATIIAAIKELDTQAKSLADTKLALAGGTMTGALILAGSPTAANEAATKNYVDSVAGGLSWQEPIVAIVADHTVGTGSYVVGDRVVNTTDDKIYTVTVASPDGGTTPATFNAGVSPADGYALFDKTTETGYVFNGSTWVQFTGTGEIVAGLGLKKTGNRLDVELSSTGSLIFSPNDTDEASVLSIKLDGSTLTSTASGLKVADATIQRITDLETEMTSTQAGSGLGTDGTYTAPAGSNYLTAATSLKDADDKLDTALKALSDNVSSMNLSFTVVGDTGSDSFSTGGILDFEGTADIVTAVTNDKVSFSLADTTVTAGTYTKITVDGKGRATSASQATTDDINEGSGNLYYTQARFDSAFGAKSTTDLAEGTNLYYTDARARDAISVETVGAGVAGLTYNSSTGVLGLNAEVASKEYVDQAESDAVTTANAYTDSVVQASVANAARSVYMSFLYTDASKAIATLPAGSRVHRIKVYVDTAFEGVDGVQVGTSTTNGDLVTTSDLDHTSTGVYSLELNKLYATETTINVYVGGTLKTAGAGAVLVEYLV